MKPAGALFRALIAVLFTLLLFGPAAAQEQPAEPITAATAAQLVVAGDCACGAFPFVESVALSPDGRTIAQSRADGTIRLWNIDGRTLYAELLAGVTGPLAFNPDGTLLAAAGPAFSGDAPDYSVTIWNVATGIRERTISTFSDAIYALAFSAGGQYLAVGGGDPFLGPGDYQVWDIEQGQRETVFHPLGNLPAGPMPLSVLDLTFNPVSGQLAAVTGDGAVRLFDPRIDFGAELALLPAEDDWSALSLAFSPDGQRLAAGGRASGCGWNQMCAPEDEDGAILIWRLADQTISGRLTGMTGPVWTVAFSPDGRLLASAGYDGLRLWDVGQAELLAHLAVDDPDIATVAFSPDGSALLTGHAKGSVQIWRVPPA